MVIGLACQNTKLSKHEDKETTDHDIKISIRCVAPSSACVHGIRLSLFLCLYCILTMLSSLNFCTLNYAESGAWKSHCLCYRLVSMDQFNPLAPDFLQF